MLVGTHNRTVDHGVLVVRARCQNLEYLLPDVTLGPSRKSRMNFYRITEALRQVPPRNARSIAVENGFHEQPVACRSLPPRGPASATTVPPVLQGHAPEGRATRRNWGKFDRPINGEDSTPAHMCMRSATTTRPTRPRRRRLGSPSIRPSSCTSHQHRRPGSTWSSGCSPKSPNPPRRIQERRRTRCCHRDLAHRAQRQTEGLQVDRQSQYHPREECTCQARAGRRPRGGY